MDNWRYGGGEVKMATCANVADMALVHGGFAI